MTPSARVGIREAKVHLSRYLRMVRKGAEIVITDRGKPVGKIVPMEATELPLADRIELTLIDRDFDGDVVFPEIEPDEWTESNCESHEDAASGLKYDFVGLDRIRQHESG